MQKLIYKHIEYSYMLCFIFMIIPNPKALPWYFRNYNHLINY